VQEYKEFYEAAVEAVDAEMNELSVAESRWIDHWRVAVDEIKQLY